MKKKNGASHAGEWNLRVVFICVILVFLVGVTGRHFTLLDAILTQHEPFKSDFNGPLTQPGLVHISDNVTQIIPSKILTQSELRKGRLPLWNPMIFCGMPHMADLHSQVFSVTDTPFLLFMSVDDALGAAALLKLVLAAYFMYLFCRHLWIDSRLALAAGLLYAFSSFTVAWIHFPSFLSTSLYFPLGLMFWDRYLTQTEKRKRRMSQVWLGLVMGLMILGGQLQLFAAFIIFTIIYALFSGRGSYTGRWLSRLIGLIPSLTLGLLIGMVQLLPAMELMIHSTRSAGEFNLFTDARAVASTPALAFSVLANIFLKIITLAFPFGWGKVLPANAQPFPEAVIYTGITALLILFAPKGSRKGPYERFLSRLCITAIVVNILSLILNSAFSFLGILEFLNPGRCAMSIAVLIIPLLAVKTIDSFLKGDRPLGEVLDKQRGGWILIALAFIFIGSGIIMGISTLQKMQASNINSLTALMFYFGELLVIGMLVLYIRRAGAMTGREKTVEALCAAMVAEALILAAVTIIPGATLSTGEVVNNRLSQMFALEKEPFRVARYIPHTEDDFKTPNILVKGRSPIVKPNEGMIIGIDDFQGYNSLNPEEFSEYVKRIDERLYLNLRGSIDLFSPEQLDSPKLDESNVLFILSMGPINHAGLTLEMSGPIYVYRRESAYPRAWFEGRDRRMNIDILDYHPGYLRAKYNSPTDGQIILSENLFPGWRCEFDGKETAIGKYVSTPFIATSAPAGQHEVVLSYKPVSFRVGFILTLAGLLFVLLASPVLSGRVYASRKRGSSPDAGTS